MYNQEDKNQLKIKRKSRKSEIFMQYCTESLQIFLKETTLHGLKYIADKSLTIWEKLFFIVSFIAAFVTVCNLISNIYAKWDTTPVIVGISPYPSSILKVPFPAITVCNMNQVLSSKVANYTSDSLEGAILKFLCYAESEFDEELESEENFKNNNLRISDFFIKHAQPCSRMLLYCLISSISYNCSDWFHEVLTDEGICCVFNILHPDFLYKEKFNLPTQAQDNIMSHNNFKAVDWNPENGYPSSLPINFYPITAYGTGISMGVSIILNAELDEYYCSSTNGAGFKISLHNPIDTPNIKETGLTVPVGYETRFRIEANTQQASPTIRSIARSRRQCVFMNEQELRYYKYYTRRNCEIECETNYLYGQCHCIPFNYPLIYSNATICSVKDSFCITRVARSWSTSGERASCLKNCLPSCFDLTFLPDSFSGKLAERNYTIQFKMLREMAKGELNKNIAIMHFYYRESVFHGDLKNVYIGFIEFLSNTGGIMGLFMGFSFISVAEIVYLLVGRPLFRFVLPQKYQIQRKAVGLLKQKSHNSHWLLPRNVANIFKKSERPVATKN